VFSRHGLEYRKHLVERAAAQLPAQRFKVSVDRLSGLLGRIPAVGAVEVCEKMAAAATPR